MRRTRITIVAITAALAMVGMSQPANANSVGVAVFTGKAKLAAPIAYPTLGVNKGATIGFTAWAGKKAKAGDPTPSVCLSAKVETADKAGKATVDADLSCGLNASGTVRPGPAGGPWCGHSAGTFAATFTANGAINGSNDQTISLGNGSWISAGSLLVITGTATSGTQTGPFVAVVVAVPNALKGGSCTGATNFLIAGVAVISKNGPSKG